MPTLPGQPQPGYDPRFGPGTPGGPGGPGEPGNPVRRRITDAFAWLSMRPPAPDATAVDPAVGPDGNPGWDGNSGWDETGRPANGNATAANGNGWAANGGPPAAGQAWNAPPPPNGDDGPSGSRPQANRNKALVAGAGVLAILAIGGVIITPKLLGSSDPGCKAYSGTTLTAYNKTIRDLNDQASQRQLTQDMKTTVGDLTGAIAQAHSASVKSALNGLLTELKTVQADVASGSVPSSTVGALNTASTTADSACLAGACWAKGGLS
jgi:hypothetical protein